MIDEDNKTIWCGNLPEQVTEEILYELFLQAGPLARVRIARERDGRPKNFAFITYNHEVSVPYAMNLFQGTSLYHRTLSLHCRGRMAFLPPPIRCYGPDTKLDFANQQPVVIQQFNDMMENLPQLELFSDQPPITDRQRQRETDQLRKRETDLSRQRDSNISNDKLVMASLQGNWSHRHHPYRPKELSHTRDNYRSRDNYDHRSRDKAWRDRRHHKKSNYHR